LEKRAKWFVFSWFDRRGKGCVMRPHMRAITAEVTIPDDGKHPRVVFRYDCLVRRQVFADRPSDPDDRLGPGQPSFSALKSIRNVNGLEHLPVHLVAHQREGRGLD
jgi:hypothetical protein